MPVVQLEEVDNTDCIRLVAIQARWVDICVVVAVVSLDSSVLDDILLGKDLTSQEAECMRVEEELDTAWPFVTREDTHYYQCTYFGSLVVLPCGQDRSCEDCHGLDGREEALLGHLVDLELRFVL